MVAAMAEVATEVGGSAVAARAHTHTHTPRLCSNHQRNFLSCRTVYSGSYSRNPSAGRARHARETTGIRGRVERRNTPINLVALGDGERAVDRQLGRDESRVGHELGRGETGVELRRRRVVRSQQRLSTVRLAARIHVRALGLIGPRSSRDGAALCREPLGVGRLGNRNHRGGAGACVGVDINVACGWRQRQRRHALVDGGVPVAISVTPIGAVVLAVNRAVAEGTQSAVVCVMPTAEHVGQEHRQPLRRAGIAADGRVRPRARQALGMRVVRARHHRGRQGIEPRGAASTLEGTLSSRALMELSTSRALSALCGARPRAPPPESSPS
eukprot:scaffold13714_cov56-Phaeocystis_antarctica.AAC.2